MGKEGQPAGRFAVEHMHAACWYSAGWFAETFGPDLSECHIVSHTFIKQLVGIRVSQKNCMRDLASGTGYRAIFVCFVLHNGLSIVIDFGYACPAPKVADVIVPHGAATDIPGPHLHSLLTNCNKNFWLYNFGVRDSAMIDEHIRKKQPGEQHGFPSQWVKTIPTLFTCGGVLLTP